MLMQKLCISIFMQFLMQIYMFTQIVYTFMQAAAWSATDSMLPVEAWEAGALRLAAAGGTSSSRHNPWLTWQ
jgi:hypothetical protein